MKAFLKSVLKLNPFNQQPFQEKFLIYVKLATLFNSHYRKNVDAWDLKNRKTVPVLVFSQFLPVKLKYTRAEVKILVWDLRHQDLKRLKIGYYSLNNKKQKHRFYIPDFMMSATEELRAKLPGNCSEIKGHLMPSGRTISFCDPKSSTPLLSIKVNTVMQTSPADFISKKLSAGDIKHSIRVSQKLSQFNYFSTEASGYALFAGSKKTPTYGYLVRTFDFGARNIKKSDFFIPVVAFLSENFWGDTSLLNALSLQRTHLKKYLLDQFPVALSELLADSHFRSHIHFELHQQNLTLQVRNGTIVRLHYHDFLDCVFDPLTYFFKNVSPDNAGQIKQTIKQICKDSLFNSQGEIRNHPRVFSDFSTVNIYSRYLRNLGDFDGSISSLLQTPFRNGFFEAQLKAAFEKQVLKFDAKLSRPSDSLFRYLDIVQQNFLNNSIVGLKEAYDTENFVVRLLPENFLKIYKTTKGFVSAAMPTDLRLLEAEFLTEIFYDSKLDYYYGTYKNNNFVAIFF